MEIFTKTPPLATQKLILVQNILKTIAFITP